jgi:hypothetical protein
MNWMAASGERVSVSWPYADAVDGSPVHLSPADGGTRDAAGPAGGAVAAPLVAVAGEVADAADAAAVPVAPEAAGLPAVAAPHAALASAVTAITAACDARLIPVMCLQTPLPQPRLRRRPPTLTDVGVRLHLIM